MNYRLFSPDAFWHRVVKLFGHLRDIVFPVRIFKYQSCRQYGSLSLVDFQLIVIQNTIRILSGSYVSYHFVLIFELWQKSSH